MIKRSIARRYARAIFDLAREQGRLEETQRDLEKAVNWLREDQALGALFLNRLVPPEEKKGLLVRAFEEQIAGGVLAFLRVIVDKHREDYLGEILAEFKTLADEARRILEVEVQTAVSLEKKELDLLKADLAARLGWEIRLKATVNPGLLGGVVMKVGDRVMDGSVKQRLETLRRQLAAR